MRVIPVVDLMDGQAVRAVAGRRQEYRPICSSLSASADPLAVAQAIRERFGFQTLYLADLDAIAGRPPALTVFSTLQTAGFSLTIDAGLRSAADVQPLLSAGVDSIVAGLETTQGPKALAGLVALLDPSRLIFSLDLKDGRALASRADWADKSPMAIAATAVTMGIRRLLVLDLARVGIGTGPGTETLCAQLKERWPSVELLAGGGIRNRSDLDRLHKAGVDGALVASALHDGCLSTADLQ